MLRLRNCSIRVCAADLENVVMVTHTEMEVRNPSCFVSLCQQNFVCVTSTADSGLQAALQFGTLSEAGQARGYDQCTYKSNGKHLSDRETCSQMVSHSNSALRHMCRWMKSAQSVAILGWSTTLCSCVQQMKGRQSSMNAPPASRLLAYLRLRMHIFCLNVKP